jgi:hypothetical protein
VIQPPAKRLDDSVIVVFSIATCQRVKIGVDTFGSDRIANEVIQRQVVYLDGLRTYP